MQNILTRTTYVVASLALVLGTLSSCSKKLEEQEKLKGNLSSVAVSVPGSEQDACSDRIDIDTFSVEQSIPTILGPALKGQPFSKAIMDQAMKNLYGRATRMTEYSYVRFKPANDEQLKALFETGLDFTDYPLDCDVVREGDYYPQPGIGENDYPWFYAVTGVGYTPPGNITKEVLYSVYPTDDVKLENEAMRLTGNTDIVNEDSCNAYAAVAKAGVTTMGVTSGRRCIRNGPLDIVCTTPPPPVSGTDPKQPAGWIKVFDKQLNQAVGVPFVKVVARRWFKKETVSTDATGKFICTKRFKNKVNIIVKMTTPDLEIRSIKGIRFWQMWYPVKTSIGKYSGRLNNIEYIFNDDNKDKTNQHKLWFASTTLASYVDYNASALSLGIGTIPTGMRILLTTFGGANGGSTPMNNHRTNGGTLPKEYVDYFIAHPGTASLSQLYNYLYNSILLKNVDVSFSYHKSNYSSSDARETIYHEFTHAAHFINVGQVWWNTFVYAEASETARYGANGDNSPYGDGSMGSISGYIGVGESWAYYMGHFMADRTYGRASAGTVLGKTVSYNDIPYTGLTAQQNALESFDPKNTNEPFRWIPTGVYYDLYDTRNETSPVTDGVSNYTNQQFFQALTTDVTTIPQFKNRLLQNSGNNQQAAVNTLFSSYGY